MNSTSAQTSIQGIVKDIETGESVIGCSVIVQGTTLGTLTGMNGEYIINDIPKGSYNLVFSFISYEKQIQKLIVTNDITANINIDLKPTSVQIKDVVVVGTRRTDTEISLLMSNKMSALTVNGISSQQIAKSQDKDASEVIRRIPGVTIRDGKFVIVRGLTERYNSVWMNGSTTPSSESDVRAFSFDVIPSGQIDNILIYKSPAPELPADFAGAMINIKTKSLVDKNSFSLSYSYGYHQGTTGKDFYTYPGGKTDWLGFDDGTRSVPASVPTTEDYKKLFDQTNADKIAQINSISKSFNSIMTPTKKVAAPDADFQLSMNKRFTVGDFSIGSISSLGYNSTNTNEKSFRAGYVVYPDTSYRYTQNSYMSRVRVSALSNWVFLFGNNQKIEFRNLFNNYGMSKTVLKQGIDFYYGANERSYELSYESRATYSGQLAGTHSFNNEKSKLDWVIGYSYANKNQPDIRKVKTTLGFDSDPGSMYSMNLTGQVVVDALGRMTLYNEENIWNGGVNFTQKFRIGNIKPELKTGLYAEKKNRNFNSRVFGYMKGPNSPLYNIDVKSYNDSAAFSDKMFSSINDVFQKKIDYKTGMVIADATDKADSYAAENNLVAGYFGTNLPFTKWMNVYLGARIEKNKQTLNSFKRDGASSTPVPVNNDTTNIFPSINATLNLTDKLLFRLAGGQTINRPEFREISPFVFYSFEDNTTIYGNPKVKNCYISNFDARFEWYPTTEEIVSLGVFYKDFKNPIESRVLYTGSGWNYTFDNAEKAKSYGLELDVRKRLHELENSGMFSFLSNLTFVMNASVIKSEIKVNSPTERTGVRELQGQSPYIVNLGVYYNDSKSKFMTSIMYNEAGKRLSLVGDPTIPHVYEMPFHSLDFTLEKGITKWASLKVGIKNLLDDEVVFQQVDVYTDIKTKLPESRIEIKQKYKPGMQFKLGLIMNF